MLGILEIIVELIGSVKRTIFQQEVQLKVSSQLNLKKKICKIQGAGKSSRLFLPQ